ncbi:MAG: ATP-dependent DNA ligase, DNA ligase (ATP), partial [Parcubacteria group bacterium GW2011_GWC1_38_22]
EDSLIYMANLGCIEINPWNSSLRNLENPDYMVFDIDPQDLPFSAAVKVAQETKKILDKISIEGYCKTSGKRGLHIYVPVAAQYSYDQVKEFAKIVNILVHRATPEISSIERKPNMRNKKVYLDYLQNRKGQTMAAAYCLRPVMGAPVSTPIEWSELNSRLDPTKFNMRTIFGRLEKKGDVWKNMLRAGKDIDLAKSLILLERLVHKKVKQKEPAHVVNNNKNRVYKAKKK